MDYLPLLQLAVSHDRLLGALHVLTLCYQQPAQQEVVCVSVCSASAGQDNLEGVGNGQDLAKLPNLNKNGILAHIVVLSYPTRGLAP